MTSLRPVKALKAEQVDKIVMIYKQCRTGLENLWVMAESPKSSPLSDFDVQSSNLKNVTRDLGKNETLNQLYSRMPESIASAAADFVTAARVLWGPKVNSAERSTAGQKRMILQALINELLGALSKKERRMSKTTDDIEQPLIQRSPIQERLPFSASATSMPALQVHSLVARGDAASLARALKGGVDVNAVDANKRTALMIAAALGKLEQAKLLLSHKADPNILDGLGCTALLLACSKGNFDMARMLLDFRADPKLGNLKARPLEYLLRFDPGSSPDNLLTIQRMMDDINTRYTSQQGDSLLAIACSLQNIPFVTMVLKWPNIDVDSKNAYGETALHKAARTANVEIVKMLIACGASTEVEGSNGKPLAVLPKACSNRLQLQSLLVPKRVLSPSMPRAPSTGVASSPTSAPVPRLTDTLRRLGDRTGRDAMSVLNELLAEAEVSGPLSPRQQQAALASPRTSVNVLSPLPSRRTSSPPPLVPMALSKIRAVADTSLPSLRVESPTTNGANSSLVLEECFEPYRLQFFNKAQFGLCCAALKTLASAAMTAKDGVFKCIAMSPTGHALHDAREDAVNACQGSNLAEKMKTYFQTVWFPDSSWIAVEDSKTFALEMLGLEAAHAANASAFRMGVVYCEGEQKGEEVCFANTEASDRFWAFMDLMGERVRVNAFSGFSGGFEDFSTPPEKQSYYVSWLSLEIMYHVAPLLNAEEQRRLLGNDLVLIYFHDSLKSSFTPYEFRGNVNSVALVVRPVSEDKYVVGCFARRRVKDFGPAVGVEVAASELRNYLLTKAVNAIVAVQKSPPFAQMISRLFSSDIEKILDKYVGSQKAVKSSGGRFKK